MSFRIQTMALALGLSFALALACRPASYEFVKDPESKRVAEPQENPRDFGPGGNPEGDDADGETTPNLPPSANVEVIFGGRSVTKIKVNSKVSIRPTLDTADADDLGKSLCVNPGIVKASYEYLSESAEANRAQGCESLAIDHTFTAPGDVLIELEVTSDEGETARAAMILTVIPADAPEADTDGGFTISASPIIAGKGQKIVFTGFCDATTKTTITWDFKDGASATGRQVVHRYDEVGQYEVEAECTDEKGKTRRAKLTIVVLEEPLLPDGVENPDLNRNPEPDTPDQGGVDPGSNPGNPKQQSRQNPPRQSPCQSRNSQGQHWQGQSGNGYSANYRSSCRR